MDQHYSTENLLVLRTLTRAVANLLRSQMHTYLSALAPVMRPAGLLGHYVQGGSKEVSRDAVKMFQELENIYGGAATSKPFGLLKELRTPFEVSGSALELSSVEYNYQATANGHSKAVSITSPFKWVLSYSDFTPARLKQLLLDKRRTDSETARFVLHYSLLQLMLVRQPALTQILEDLRFNIASGPTPEFGDLPVISITSLVPTVRPPDDVIIQATEIAGRDTFEELIDVEGVLAMRDPLKDRLTELVKTHGGG